MIIDNTLTSSYSLIQVTLISGQQFYFGSLAAIYHFLTPDQLGVTLTDLYRHEDTFKKTGKFANHKCSLKRIKVMRAKQKGSVS